MSEPELPLSLNVELVALQTFVVVARLSSFSAAASRLNVTQPTVTGRIHRLEASVGQQLLRRTTRKVELTEAGALLLKESVRALEELSRLIARFREADRRARQRVVIAATPSIAAWHLPPVLHAYADRYPDVDLELLDLKYEAVLEAIDNGSANVAILAPHKKEKRHRFTPLWQDEMVLVVPRNHPFARRKSIRPEELAGMRLILVDQYRAVHKRIMAALQPHDLSMPAPKVVSTLNTLLGLLDADMGATLLPRFALLQPHVKKHAAVEIKGLDTRRAFGMLVAQGTQPSAALQSFMRFLQQVDWNARA